MSDPVDEVIQAYLDHLEKGAPEPSFDHLTPDQRQLAEDLINSLHAGRGINPYQSRPSFSGGVPALVRCGAACRLIYKSALGVSFPAPTTSVSRAELDGDA